MEFKNQRNPILPLEYHIPDGEAHMMPDGKLYVYGSYDTLEMAFCSQEYHVVSTSDLKHWTVHDVSFHADDVPWTKDPKAPKYPGFDWSHPTPFLQKILDLQKTQAAVEQQKNQEEDVQQSAVPIPQLLFAPDCISRDGKYYLYFCMSDDSEGVAVSDKPEGPFHSPQQLPCGGIDPAVFIDEDGQAYYYWGQFSAHGVKLNEDMVSFDAAKVIDNIVTEEEHFFHEGSSMRRRGDIYYYVFADIERGKPTALGYAMGKTPLGPFQYQGIIIDNDGCDPMSWNNHGSIECVNGQWYVFYHRCSRNTQQHRRLCIEKIYFNEDGTIDEVKMTSQGIGDPFAPGEEIFGYQACRLKGACYIDVDKLYDYREKLTNFSDGDEALFRYIKSDKDWSEAEIVCTGSAEVTVMMKSVAESKIQSAVEEDSTWMEVGKSMVQGEPGKVQSAVIPVRMAAGEYELKLHFENVDHVELLSVTVK